MLPYSDYAYLDFLLFVCYNIIKKNKYSSSIDVVKILAQTALYPTEYSYGIVQAYVKDD